METRLDLAVLNKNVTVRKMEKLTEFSVFPNSWAGKNLCLFKTWNSGKKVVFADWGIKISF